MSTLLHPHKFSYIVAILIHNHFESPNTTTKTIPVLCAPENTIRQTTFNSIKSAVIVLCPGPAEEKYLGRASTYFGAPPYRHYRI
jgi:hypothetical protein